VYVKTILAPVDFSSATQTVVTEATALARSLDGKVILLSVIQPPAPVAEYAAFLENIAEITAAGEKAAARNLTKLQAQLEAAGVTCETLQFVGTPIQHITQQAEKLKADYIVMGSHGHTALYDLLVGSTTHGVLLRAKCPVVILPAEKRKATKAKK
jgi:nucleotide-binding universal stress UspA family protein